MRIQVSLSGHVCYKIVSINDNIIRSYNTGRELGRLEKGTVLDEVYVNDSKNSALKFMTNSLPNEVLLTLSYKPQDIVGDYQPGQPTFTLKKATVISFEKVNHG